MREGRIWVLWGFYKLWHLLMFLFTLFWNLDKCFISSILFLCIGNVTATVKDLYFLWLKSYNFFCKIHLAGSKGLFLQVFLFLLPIWKQKLSGGIIPTGMTIWNIPVNNKYKENFYRKSDFNLKFGNKQKLRAEEILSPFSSYLLCLICDQFVLCVMF